MPALPLHGRPWAGVPALHPSAPLHGEWSLKAEESTLCRGTVPALQLGI